MSDDRPLVPWRFKFQIRCYDDEHGGWLLNIFLGVVAIVVQHNYSPVWAYGAIVNGFEVAPIPFKVREGQMLRRLVGWTHEERELKVWK